MEYINKIKKMLCKELEEYSTKHKLNVADLEMVHKLTDTVKNLDKITMLEEEGGYSEARHPMGIYRDEYSRDGGEWRAMGSYDDGVSYRRGRGRNAKRDSMGRYSSDGGYSEEGYSEEHRGGTPYHGGYSRNDVKDYMVEQIEEMMENTDSPKEKEALRRCMMSLKNA